MNRQKATELLKKAIILEKQGQTFYRSVSNTTSIEAIKEIFNTMADEEKFHEETLSRQLDYFINKGGFTSDFHAGNTEEFSDFVLSPEIINSIKAAEYEASAISAAMALEIRSAEFYSQQAEDAVDSREKEFFTFLANWENSHLKSLSELNRKVLENALKEDIY